MLCSFKPARSSFHSLFGSTGSGSFCFLPKKLIRSILAAGLATGIGPLACTFFYCLFLGKGTMLSCSVSYLARILFRIHLIISSEIPSLPQRWMAWRPVARVRNPPISLITWAGNPVVCKSMCTKYGLYFMKFLIPSSSSRFLAERGASVSPSFS